LINLKNSICKNLCDILAYKPAVLKTIPKLSFQNDKHISHILNEKQVTHLYTSQLAFLKKPTIYLFEKEQNFACFQDLENVYFLMEYFPGGDLASLFKGHRINMTVEDIKMYLAQI
jgi:serine/threonine protein kinase